MLRLRKPTISFGMSWSSCSSAGYDRKVPEYTEFLRKIQPRIKGFSVGVEMEHYCCLKKCIPSTVGVHIADTIR